MPLARPSQAAAGHFLLPWTCRSALGEERHAAPTCNTDAFNNPRCRHKLITKQVIKTKYHLAFRRMHEELKATSQSGRLAAQAAAGVGESASSADPCNWCTVAEEMQPAGKSTTPSNAESANDMAVLQGRRCS
jgi:hypothetical protein